MYQQISYEYPAIVERAQQHKKQQSGVTVKLESDTTNSIERGNTTSTRSITNSINHVSEDERELFVPYIQHDIHYFDDIQDQLSHITTNPTGYSRKGEKWTTSELSIVHYCMDIVKLPFTATLVLRSKFACIQLQQFDYTHTPQACKFVWVNYLNKRMSHNRNRYITPKLTNTHNSALQLESVESDNITSLQSTAEPKNEVVSDIELLKSYLVHDIHYFDDIIDRLPYIILGKKSTWTLQQLAIVHYCIDLMYYPFNTTIQNRSKLASLQLSIFNITRTVPACTAAWLAFLDTRRSRNKKYKKQGKNTILTTTNNNNANSMGNNKDINQDRCNIEYIDLTSDDQFDKGTVQPPALSSSNHNHSSTSEYNSEVDRAVEVCVMSDSE